MTIGERADGNPVPTTAPAKQKEAGSDGNQQRFTGVVLIHGLGLIARNGMLQQALNALTYWFNHEGGLGLESKGTGRIWLTPHLTDNPDPDQPASRAIVDLVAPGANSTTPDRDAAVRLEFREVWWAESFGLPDISQTIAWAQLQWREQASRLLIPIRWQIWGGETSNEAPPRQSPRGGGGEHSYASLTREVEPPSAADGSLDLDRPRLGIWTSRLMKGVLGLYSLYQYIWKVVQWLILTPVVTLLLLVMGIVQVLAVIPFLRAAVITTSTAIIDTIMLHWVAEIQVYLTDYTRSSALRERFVREVEELLRNPLCDRVVVIGESGGTYMAYEGLTTLLARTDLPLDNEGQPKPITFVSIATALRRIWLLSNTDPHRMRGVLPKYVRWLHFWARYDPVAAGPLTVDSIPRIPTWEPPDENPYEAIRDSLRRCINVSVVNTDSTLTDHVHYWDNLEQVVGPIAHELVAGHPVLEEAVRSKLASPSEVLLRRWGVAWRYTLAFVAGVAAGIAVLFWDAQHPEFGTTITTLLGQVDWGGIVNSVCSHCTAIVGNSASTVSQPAQQQIGQYSSSLALTYLVRHYLTVQNLVVVAVALIVMGLVDTLIAHLAARPTPFRFSQSLVASRQHLGTRVVLGAIGIGLLFVASLIFTNDGYMRANYAAGPSEPAVIAYIWALGLGELAYVASLVVALVAIIQQRQGGWGVALLLSLIPLYAADPFYRSALLTVAVIGCIVSLFGPSSVRSATGKIALAVVAIMVVDEAMGTILFDFNVIRTPLLGAGVYVEFLLPPLIYALWSGRPKLPRDGADLSAPRRTLQALALAYLAVANLVILPAVSIVGNSPHSLSYSIGPSLDIFGTGSTPPGTLRAVGVLIALLISVLMLVLCLLDVRNERRWGWLIGILILFAGLTLWFTAFYEVGVKSTLPEGALQLSFALAATALTYGLWAGPSRWQAKRKSTGLQPTGS